MKSTRKNGKEKMITYSAIDTLDSTLISDMGVEGVRSRTSSPATPLVLPIHGCVSLVQRVVPAMGELYLPLQPLPLPASPHPLVSPAKRCNINWFRLNKTWNHVNAPLRRSLCIAS